MRVARQDQERWSRRRRQPGSLDKMVTSNLGLPEGCKDPAYHYHWINDIRGWPQVLTTQDDYEIVTFDMLQETAQRNRAGIELDRDAFTSGTGSNVTRVVERDGTRAVLMRKPLDFYEHDYEEALDQRQAMMEARVYHGDVGGEIEGAPEGELLSEENVYVPKENDLGSAGRRRKGPIPRRFK